MYVPLGIVVALAAFLAVNALVSFGVALVAPRVLRQACLDRPQRRARLLFGLRLLPSLAATVAVLGVIVPAYVRFEPRGTLETPGLSLLAMACGALLLLAAAARRGLASWGATSRLVREWMRDAQPVVLPGDPGVAYRVRDRFPVVSLVGALRPRIFVARQVLDALSSAEVSAAVAHETAHLRFRDNLKRLVLRACPDILTFLPPGREIERAWGQASETAADIQAAGGDTRKALDLGSALLKVARMAPSNARPAWSVSTLHDGADVADRVRRLVTALPPPECGGRFADALRATALAAILVLAPAVACLLGTLSLAHRLTEAAILFLP